MKKSNSIWSWLSDEKNRKILAFIGGAIVVVVGAGWQAYLHFSKSPSSKSGPATVTAETGGVAAGGNITVGGDFKIGISLEEYENGLKKREQEIRAEISKIENKDEAKRKELEKQLASAEKRMANLKKAYAQEKKSLEDTAALLLELQKTFDSNALATALEALSKGNTDEAELLLQKVVAEEKTKKDASMAARQLSTLASAREDTARAAYYQKQAKSIAARPAEYFFDDFNGDTLGPHWEVRNPNSEYYYVENGGLNVIVAKETPLNGNETLDNIFLLTGALPRGDWTATVRMIPKIQTFREQYILAFYRDKDNMLSGAASNNADCCGDLAVMRLISSRVSQGKVTNFTNRAIASPALGNFYSGTESVQKFIDWTNANIQAIYLRLEKKGRSYTFRIKVEGESTGGAGKNPMWTKLQSLTSIRPPGDNLVLAFRQKPYTNPNYHVQNGEGFVTVDWFKIETGAAQ